MKLYKMGAMTFNEYEWELMFDIYTIENFESQIPHLRSTASLV
jgi:chlorite dismutase